MHKHKPCLVHTINSFANEGCCSLHTGNQLQSTAYYFTSFYEQQTVSRSLVPPFPTPDPGNATVGI